MSPTYRVTELLNVSAVFVTRNAANQLGPALRSVQFCRDIVVLDAGSTDETCDLAARLGARVIRQEWLGNGLQKQKAVALAKFDWVLCLDADERVTPELASHIERVLKQPDHAVWRMPRRHFFIDRYLRHGAHHPDHSIRLFDRRQARWSDDPLQPRVLTDVPIGLLEGDLLHHPTETLGVYLDQQNQRTETEARALAAQGVWPGTRQLWLSPLLQFIQLYVLRQGYRDGWPGFVYIAIGCFNHFMKLAKTRSLQAARNPD